LEICFEFEFCDLGFICDLSFVIWDLSNSFLEREDFKTLSILETSPDIKP